MAIQYFTDNNLDFSKRSVFVSEEMAGAVTLTPASAPSATNFLGFGIAFTDASCYLLNEMEPDARTELLKNVYTKEGLNLSVARVSIGSTDYSAELYSYCDGGDIESFSIERDKAYKIPMIKELLAVNPDIYLFASPWSPPGWMKTGGKLCGGYMRREFIGVYADYIVKFIKAYAENGIKISAITPQNEPETSQGGKMPACIWHPEIEAEYILTLRKKLNEAGLDTKIWMYDHNFDGIDRVLWTLDNTEGLAEVCDGVAFHYYAGNIEQTNALTNKYPKLARHFTEGGPRLFDNYGTDWCKWGSMITKVLCNGYSSFTAWNLILDEMGRPNIGPYFCGGLITQHSVTKELTFSGQYKAFRHIAPYINKASVIYPLISNEVPDVMSQYPKQNTLLEGFLIDNATEKVVVLVNKSDNKKQVCIKLDDTCYYVECLTDTISTIII